MSEALAQAIERHKAAWAAWLATEEDEADEIANALGDEERDAKWELATLRCDSVADLLAKLQYLFELERRTWAGWSEPASECHEPFGCVVVAIDAHLNPDDYYEEA